MSIVDTFITHWHIAYTVATVSIYNESTSDMLFDIYLMIILDTIFIAIPS